MLDNELRHSVAELQDTAEKLKVLARRTRSPDARDALLDLAARCERVARCMDGAPPGG